MEDLMIVTSLIITAAMSSFVTYAFLVSKERWTVKTACEEIDLLQREYNERLTEMELLKRRIQLLEQDEHPQERKDYTGF